MRVDERSHDRIALQSEKRRCVTNPTLGETPINGSDVTDGRPRVWVLHPRPLAI